MRVRATRTVERQPRAESQARLRREGAMSCGAMATSEMATAACVALYPNRPAGNEPCCSCGHKTAQELSPPGEMATAACVVLYLNSKSCMLLMWPYDSLGAFPPG